MFNYVHKSINNSQVTWGGTLHYGQGFAPRGRAKIQNLLPISHFQSQHWQQGGSIKEVVLLQLARPVSLGGNSQWIWVDITLK